MGRLLASADRPRPAHRSSPSLGIVAVVVGLVVAAWGALGIPVRATVGARTTADEPQYLLTATSLAEDGSLDISDELAAGRWRDFHESELPTQTQPFADGREVSPHDPLLPVLLAVPVAVAGASGAKAFLALLGGVLAGLLVWVAVRRFGVRALPAGVVVAAFALSPPLAAYATQVYPELPAALAVAVAVAAITGPLRRGGVALAVVAVVALPWLGVKYAPVAMALAATLIWRLVVPADALARPRPSTRGHRRVRGERDHLHRSAAGVARAGDRRAGSNVGRLNAPLGITRPRNVTDEPSSGGGAAAAPTSFGRLTAPAGVSRPENPAHEQDHRAAAMGADLRVLARRAAVPAVGLVGAGIAYLALHRLWYGGWTVYAAGDHFVGGELDVVGVDADYLGRSQRLVGLLVDRDFGLAAWGPVVLVAVAALGGLVRRRSDGWGVLLVPLLAGWLNATFVALTMHGVWWPGRQVVVVLPCAVLATAWWVDRMGRRALLVVAALGVAGMALWATLLWQEAFAGWALIIDVDRWANPLVGAWRRTLPDNRDGGPTAGALQVAWTVALAGLAAWAWRATPDAEAVGTERRGSVQSMVRRGVEQSGSSSGS